MTPEAQQARIEAPRAALDQRAEIDRAIEHLFCISDDADERAVKPLRAIQSAITDALEADDARALGLLR